MSVQEAFWAAPPVSRTITAAAVVLSVPTWMGLIEPYYVVWLTYKVFTWRALPEIWRLVTPFILTGPKLGMILDPYFLYTYGSQLEIGAPRFSGPGDFLTYLVFVCVVILFTCGYWLNGVMFLSPLTLALAYTYAQENPHRQMTYFIVTFSVKYLPYAMLAMTFVMDSPGGALLQATGLVAAHAYEFVARIWPEFGGGRKLIHTPLFVQRWFASAGGVPQARTYGTAFSGRTTPSAGAGQDGASGGRAWTSGSSTGWNARGEGRRLGGS